MRCWVMAAWTDVIGAHAKRAPGRAPWMTRATIQRLGKSKAPGARCTGFRERGRRRTRQDQISLWALRPGEIAERERSTPKEENQFLLPDRFSMERLSSSKDRSSRLT